MKAMMYLLVAALLFSCIDDVDNVEEQYPQQWQLVRMTGSLNGSEKSGRYLDWQEFYLFKADGTFLKSRVQDGIRTSVTGTFVREDTEDEHLLILTFDEASEIIGSCDPELKESLILLSSSLLISSWPACDGPGLEYRRFQ